MKKCLIVSDSFKGTLSSKEICEIAKDVFSREFPDWTLNCIPVADGGEGTVDCFVSALGAEARKLKVCGPFQDETEAVYGVYEDKAIIEMAAAAGLPLVGDRKEPSKAGTYGVGQLIAHAVESGCKEILLGLGGSASNDGGCGCAAALGVIFKDADGNNFIPTGATLSRIARIDITPARKKLHGVKITAMCDVTNPLFGENGAAYVFAPQKGADENMVELLDDGLMHMAQVIKHDLNIDVAEVPGAGAAGGMGAGCIAFLGGSLQSGINAVLNAAGFDELLKDSSLVITGEGKIDSQSIDGKLISGIARRTEAAGIPLAVIAGCIDDTSLKAYNLGISVMFSTNRAGLPFEKLSQRAAEDYRRTLRDFMRSVNLLLG